MRKIIPILLLAVILALAGCGPGEASPSTTPPTSPQASSTSTTGGSEPPSGTPAPTPVSSEPVSLRIGSLPRIFDLVLYTAQQEGIFEKNGLAVEIVPFRSVVERNNAFLAGQLDGFVDSIYEAININKEQEYCKAVGHALMPSMFEIVVSPSSGIDSPAQLKGKEIATSTATIMEYALDTLLASEGIGAGEVSYVNVPNMPLRLEMMAQGQLDAAILTPPLSKAAIAAGNKLILDDTKQLLAGPGLIFSDETIQSKPDGINRFISSWQETVKIINASPDNYRGLLASTAQVPDTLAASYEVPVFPEVRPPSQEELSLLLDWMKSKDMLKTDIPYEQIVDTRNFN
ncbi:MAG: ABC transporter substrate-binding protein [Dehalococcoidales bacterium]|nr:ABC transporter substrate-binding protein [Dehalococcoidales bacterium]